LALNRLYDYIPDDKTLHSHRCESLKTVTLHCNVLHNNIINIWRC
jgi:hypothetical protein